MAIAATRQLTGCGTAIGAVIVAIVADFTSLPHEAIATRRYFTGGWAPIGIHIIGIVAGLNIDLNDAVTTHGLGTGVGALITVFFVAVVALFITFDDRVTTHRQFWIRLITRCEKPSCTDQ